MGGPVYIAEVVHFSRNLKAFDGPRQKQLCMEMTMPELITLMSYVSERGESPAQPRAGN